MKKILGTLSAVAFAVSASASFAACDAGEKVVKLSHVTGGTTHPKVVAANNFAERVNKDLNASFALRFIRTVHCSVTQKSSKHCFLVMFKCWPLLYQSSVLTRKSMVCLTFLSSSRTWMQQWHSPRLRRVKTC